MKKENIPEFKKKNADDVADEMEHERVIVNWIEYKAKWWKSCTKKELNWDKNDKIDTCKCLWGIKMKIIFDHLIQESGEERPF